MKFSAAQSFVWILLSAGRMSHSLNSGSVLAIIPQDDAKVIERMVQKYRYAGLSAFEPSHLPDFYFDGQQRAFLELGEGIRGEGGIAFLLRN